ncbi:6-phosphofructo-2-kinase-domain-containing protein, partial [Baffinella frigidus]
MEARPGLGRVGALQDIAGSSQQSPSTNRHVGGMASNGSEVWLSATHILKELSMSADRNTQAEFNSSDRGSRDRNSSRKEPVTCAREQKLLLVMVGLPARGKSFIAHRLTNYLSWTGLHTRVFNVGAYRRSVGGNEDAEFFDHGNKFAAEARENLAWVVLDELLTWLCDGNGDVAIFDATNTTDDRRRRVLEHAQEVSAAKGTQTTILFIESVCDDPKILEANLNHKVRCSPDFVGISAEQALADFKERVRKYELVYRTISDDDLSYIKVMNLSSKVVCNKIYGRIQ